MAVPLGIWIADHPGRWSDVWRETSRATPLDNVIDVHKARLRHKIDERFDRKLIHTTFR
jgi:DNA-binding response OmpR family regulator